MICSKILSAKSFGLPFHPPLTERSEKQMQKPHGFKVHRGLTVFNPRQPNSTARLTSERHWLFADPTNKSATSSPPLRWLKGRKEEKNKRRKEKKQAAQRKQTKKLVKVKNSANLPSKVRDQPFVCCAVFQTLQRVSVPPD